MADNTTQSGADTIATDDVTTLNGAASSGVKVQRVKIGFGDDNTHRDASAAFPLPVLEQPATTAVSATAAISTAATLTISAPGAGLFIYLTSLSLTLYSGAARTGAAAPVVVTTTNLGSLAWSFSTAGAIGVNETQILSITGPLKAAAAATAVTIVAPLTTGGIWRLNATYFIAA